MILSKETIDILQSFLVINNGVVVKPGKALRIFAEPGDVFVRANVPEEFVQEFAIYDLAQFINVISKLFENPELKFNPKSVEIKDKNSSCEYFYSDPDLIKYFNTDIVIDDKNVVLNFDLTNDQITELRNAAGVLGLDIVTFSNIKGKLTATLSLKEGSKQDTYSITLGDSGTTDEFELKLKSERLRIYKGDYKIRIEKKPKIIMLNAKNQTTDIEYFIAMGAESTYGN